MSARSMFAKTQMRDAEKREKFLDCVPLQAHVRLHLVCNALLRKAVWTRIYISNFHVVYVTITTQCLSLTQTLVLTLALKPSQPFEIVKTCQNVLTKQKYPHNGALKIRPHKAKQASSHTNTLVLITWFSFRISLLKMYLN